MAQVNRLLALLLTLELTGCVLAEGEEELQELSQWITDKNALSTNALSTNALSTNALSTNALTSSVISPKRYALNTQATSGMESTEYGRELLLYLAKCALNPDESVVFTFNGVQYEYPGLLGIAPDWKTRPITIAEQQALSGCLLAHVNDFGVHVPISVRRYGIDDTTQDERTRYNKYEGTFYGNLFSSSQLIYACMGDPAPNFLVAYPNHDTTQGDRLLRRCTDPTAADPGQTECGFTYVGQCSNVCDTETGGSYSNCWSNANHSGSRYAETMSAWLLQYDDVESVWPDLYPQVYGP